MAIDPLTALLDVSGKVIDKIWPDPIERDKAKLELLRLQQSGELAGIVAQMDVNKIEAANPNMFVSGWRPFVGWVCGMGLVYTFIGQPLLAWGSLYWTIPAPPSLDMGDLLTILLGMLGLGGLRSYEKVKGVAAQ